MYGLILALVMMAFTVFTVITNRQDEQAMRDAHAQELERRDIKIEQLIDQMQLNAQHMPYYPQVGPFEPAPEPQPMLADIYGYLSSPDLEDEDLDAVVGD